MLCYVVVDSLLTYLLTTCAHSTVNPHVTTIPNSFTVVKGKLRAVYNFTIYTYKDFIAKNIEIISPPLFFIAYNSL